MKVSVMRALIAAGATAEMLIAAAEAEEAEQNAQVLARRQKDAERKRKSRAASAMSHGHTVTDADACGQDVTGADPSPKQRKVSPNPSKETQPSPSTPSHPSDAPAPKPAADRGSRLAADWRPSADDWQFAVSELGWPMAEREAEKFRNYWLSKSGKDGRKVDWGRTWRNWVMAANDRFGGGNGRNRNNDNGSTRGAAEPSPFFAALARQVAERSGPVEPIPPSDPWGGSDSAAAPGGAGAPPTIDVTPSAGERSGGGAGGGYGPRLFALPSIGRG